MRMMKIQNEVETLTTVAKKFLRVKEAQHCSMNTLRDYREQISKFLLVSSGSLEYAVLEDDVLHFFASIPDTSPARYNKPFQNINSLFNWMVEQNYIPKNPIKALKLRKRKDEGNIKPVDINDLQMFLGALDGSSYTGLRNYTIILIMLDTGIRTKELLSLRNDDYLCDTKCLVIEKTVAKTRTKRMVFLSSSTAYALERFLTKKPAVWEDWLFPNYEGKQLKVDHLDKSFSKHSAECGIKITPYQLRHTFATLYLKNGGDLFSLQHIMGHADLRMTKRYTELDEDYVQSQHKSFSPVNLLNEKKSSRMVRVR